MRSDTWAGVHEKMSFSLMEWHFVKMKFPGQDLYPDLICKENDTGRVSVCMFPYRIFDCRLH